VDRLSSNKGMIRDYGLVLDSAASLLDDVSSVQGAKRAVDTLRSATNSASARMHALEHLFAASVMRINELHEELARTEKDASCDALTGLANRRAFEAALMRDAAQADKDGTALALLLLDIDHFKTFNDLHGHIMGDKLLRLVSQLLTRQIKGRDTAARYGGEEFAVILMQADLPAALKVAEQIRAMLSKAPLLNRATAQTLGIITCSIGVAEYRPGEQLTDLIDRADRALYEAKRTGRNRVSSENDVTLPGTAARGDLDLPVDSTVH
jgi:diguanylate cyclase